jgi:hypothetical protein
MEYYRLEYKESTGDFHFEDNKERPEFLYGWKTISKGLPSITCENFVKRMHRKYKGLSDRRYKPPIFEIIQNEFFIKS